MKASKIVKEYLCTLEHFLEQGGHPLKVAISEAQAKSANFMSPKEAADLCKVTGGAFAIENGFLFRDKSHGLDWEIVAEYWKFRCKEEQKELTRVFNIIDTAHRKL
jgi:hypothetical protein